MVTTPARSEPSLAPVPSAQAAAPFDLEIFEDIISKGDADQRRELARQLGTFYCSLEITPEERLQLKPIVLKLAVDEVQDVRAGLAAKLKRGRFLHPDIIFTVVADIDEIGVDFVKVSPALSAIHVLTILRVGDVARRVGLAGRGDLSQEAVQLIIAEGEREVILELLENPFALIGSRGYGLIYNRFRDDATVLDRLLAKNNLPLEIRLLQAKRASDKIHTLVRERQWMPVADTGDLIADAEENVISKILLTANEAELDRAMAFMIRRKMLTTSIVMRAACHGQYDVLVKSLAALTGQKPQKVQQILSTRRASSLRALLARAGFPQSCVSLVSIICEVEQTVGGLEERPDPMTYGRAIVQWSMTRHKPASDKSRNQLFDLIGQFADKRTRIIAARLQDELAVAA